MKKKLFLVALLTSLIVNAQDRKETTETESQKRMTEFSKRNRHNLSLDVIAGLAFPAFNPRYEYILNKHSSIGADLNINFDDDNGSEILEKFSFSPFYRQYFFSKEDYGAKGFYGEAFIKFYTYEDDIRYDVYTNEIADAENYFETAIGVGIGWKWVSNSGFFIDLSGGLGRNLGFASGPSERELAGKFGLNFGWQF